MGHLSLSQMGAMKRQKRLPMQSKKRHLYNSTLDHFPRAGCDDDHAAEVPLTSWFSALAAVTAEETASGSLPYD
jgi:hypothetical protein